MGISTHWPPVGLVPKPLRGPSHSWQRGVLNSVTGFTGPALGAGAAMGGVEIYNHNKPKSKQIKLLPTPEAAKRRAKRKIAKAYPFGPGEAIPANKLSPDQRAKYREGLKRRAGAVPYAPPRKQKALAPIPDRGRKVKQTKVKDPKGAYRLQRKQERSTKYAVAQEQAALRSAAVERKAVPPAALEKRPFIRHAQISSMATKPAIMAAGAGYLKSRNDKRKRGEKPVGGRAVDAAVGAGVGATTTDLGMIAGGWSTKRLAQRHRNKAMGYTDKSGVRHEGKWSPKRRKAANDAWEGHKKKWGFKQLAENNPGDKVDATSGPVQQKIMRTYPKQLPAWKTQRALAWKNHTAVGPAVGLAGALGGGYLALKASQKKKESVGKALSQDKKDLERSRKVQGALSLGGASIGLAALGTKGGSIAARKLVKPVIAGPAKKPLSTKLNEASIGLTTLGAGVGGASGIHFYRLMAKENKVHKADEAYEYRKREKAAYEAGRYVPLGADDVVQPGPPAREKPAMKILPKSGGINVENRRQKRMKAEQYGAVGAAGALAGAAAGQVRPKAIKSAVKGKTVLRSLKSKNAKVAGGLALGAGAAGATAAGIGQMRNKQGKAYTDWWDG